MVRRSMPVRHLSGVLMTVKPKEDERNNRCDARERNADRRDHPRIGSPSNDVNKSSNAQSGRSE